VVDPARLRSSFDRVARHGDEVPLFFYSALFLTHPQTRRLFPPSMATQRDRLVGALGTIVSRVDDLDSLVPFVQQLGRDHRKFGVIADHYPAVGQALLATLEHFLGDEWTPELAKEWTQAYQVVSGVMFEAAEAEAGTSPPWWEAEVIAHERRAADLAVITVRTQGRLTYLPGQSLSVQTAQRPRMWRFYSPANAVRPDGLIEFHVRAADGGWVSSALVHSVGVGDVLLLGPPVGELTLDRESRRDLLLLAGGTGLAPLRAMVDDMAREIGWARRVHLVHAGRREQDLYDLATLQRVAAATNWLTVVPVAELGPTRSARIGTAADVALQLGRWHDHDIYICGSDAMVAYSRDLLARAGVEPARVRHESFGYRDTSVDALPPEEDVDAAAADVAEGHRPPVHPAAAEGGAATDGGAGWAAGVPLTEADGVRAHAGHPAPGHGPAGHGPAGHGPAGHGPAWAEQSGGYATGVASTPPPGSTGYGGER
jgi:NAD(P)H-flavin reductase/hemoglobin-like flavoprotein